MRSSNPASRGRHVKATLLFLLAFSVWNLGCGAKKSTILGPEPTTPYPPLTTPENTLGAMIRAYSNRDTVELRLVYDDGYQGTSYDQDDWLSVLSFTKADEIAHVAALARASTVTRVSVSFNPVLRRYTDFADPPGWASIQNPIRSVEIEDGGTTHDVYLSYETLTYKLIPKTPDNASPTDTTWKIVGWSEIAFSVGRQSES